MIKIDNIEVYGWQAAVRGMRNPKNSWDKSDSGWSFDLDMDMDSKRPIGYVNWEIGKADHELMMKLVKGGSVHAKFRRMITVTMDITAPLYWVSELDTYKVGTVRNSCSFMHRGVSKPFSIEDFSFHYPSGKVLDIWRDVVDTLNELREHYLATKDETIFQQIRCLLPSGYMQRFTWQANYEVLANIYASRKNHRLDEWREFCRIMKEQLPYSELFTGEEDG